MGNHVVLDVSAIGDEMFGLNHNVFAGNRSLIDDIARLVLTGTRRPINGLLRSRRVPGAVPVADLGITMARVRLTGSGLAKPNLG
jgi:hypothetical protein